MSVASYQIRLARHADLPLLGNIERAAGILFLTTKHSYVASHEPMSLSQLTEAQLHGHLWIAANHNDVPVGFALVDVVDGHGHLHELSVHPDHGRRGLGARLIAAVCEWSTAQGYCAITLSTFRDVHWNAPFYLRLGFRILAEHELTAGLLALREVEKSHGLSVIDRVFMRHELPATN